MSWQSKALGLCKKYGSSAKFAATTILGIVPGGSALNPLIEKIFDTAQKSSQDDWELNLSKELHITAENVLRLEQVLDLLGGDLQHLMAQMASLQQLPEMARQLLEVARDNDDRAKAALGKLDLIVHRFDRLEAQNQQVLTGQQSATRMIEEILIIVRGSTAPKQSETQVQTAANTISKKKQSIESKELFLDASAESGTLILSNEDVELLMQLKDRHRESIRSLYAPCCTRMEDKLIKKIEKLPNLEILDLSSCPSITESAFDSWGVNQLPLLREVYLRSCRRIVSRTVFSLARKCPNIESLYLDGIRLLDVGVIVAAAQLPALQTLSVVGCTQLRTREFAAEATRLIPNCTLIGP